MRNRKVTCPFCKDEFDETCEYVDVGVGYIQCTPNFCENCHAYEKYPDDDGKREDMEYAEGWTRMKNGI